MKRRILVAFKLLPITMVFAFGACGITERQFADFAMSTGLRVFVQTLASIAEATVIANQ